MEQITVGFPVYNGASSIEQSLRCILEGTLQDIRVLVSDNGSSDDTVTIVESIAKQDSRVTLIQQPENLGAVGNFRFLAEQATTPFFMWRAHDDLSDNDYLETLLDCLRVNPQAVLAASNILTTKINREKKRPFKVRLKENQRAGWKDLPRVQAAWVYGLFNTRFAQKSIAYTDDHYGHLFGCDMIMLFQALLDGGVVGTNATTFNQRSLVKGKPEQQADKAKRRKIVKDFFASADNLASQYGITGMKRHVLRLYLLRYISQRVVRWQKLI